MGSTICVVFRTLQCGEEKIATVILRAVRGPSRSPVRAMQKVVLALTATGTPKASSNITRVRNLEIFLEASRTA